MRLLRSFCHTSLLPYFPDLYSCPKRSQNVALRGLARKLKRIHSMTQSSDSTSPEQDAAARDSTQMPGQTPDIGSSLNESANESANEKTTNDKAAPEAANETAAAELTADEAAEPLAQRAHDELEQRVAQRTLELTRINEELRGSEERFSQAFMASPLPILITTLQEGRVLDLNPSALRSLERKRDDVIGQIMTQLGDWKFSLGNREQIVQRLQQEGTLSNVEATFRTAAGKTRDAMIFIKMIEVNGEKCVLAMVQDVTERKRAEQERKQLLQRIVMAQKEERRRISRELHDQMGQQLTVLMMGMKALPEHPDAGWSKPSYETQVEDLQKLTVELMQQMHRLAWDLRPASLDNLGLEAALRQYVEQWSEQSGVQAEVVSTGLSAGARPSPEVETALYRVVQEALTNAQRHAQATHVSVLVERRKDNVIAVIEDDGCGYQTKEKKEGPDGQQRPARLGLLGMGERMELVGGTLTIESSPGQGTTVFARASMKGREAP